MNRHDHVVFDTRVVTGSGGGPDKTILNSPRFLEPLGYRMICGYLHPPNDPGYSEIVAKAQRYNAPLISIPDRGAWDWRVFGQLLNVCRREKVTIWHGHDYKTNALGLALKPFWPMHLVTTVHGWVHHTSRTPIYYRIDQLCLPRYKRVICVSDDLLNECLRRGVPRSRAMLLENAIDVDEYQRKLSIDDAKHKLSLSIDHPVIGAVGRLEPEKGFDLLIEAVARLHAAGTMARLVIVGEGHDRVRLEGIIASFKLHDWVTLAGWQSDVRTYFEAMDIFALSSYREGLPNVLLEAMALRVPCVATAIAGIPKLIEHESNGLLIEPGQVTPLRNALSKLLDNPKLRADLAEAGRRTIETRYSFNVRMERMAALYDAIVS